MVLHNLLLSKMCSVHSSICILFQQQQQQQHTCHVEEPVDLHSAAVDEDIRLLCCYLGETICAPHQCTCKSGIQDGASVNEAASYWTVDWVLLQGRLSEPLA